VASRHKAREALLRAIYLSESRDISYEQAFAEMESFSDNISESEDEANDLKPFALGLDESQKEFAISLSRIIRENKDYFNKEIEKVLKNWDFSRISRIDRIIMWIALAEMKRMLDIPPRVSINEALELSKKFSSEKSTSFINGVLDAAASNMGIVK